jgi:hypothetical protein
MRRMSLPMGEDLIQLSSQLTVASLRPKCPLVSTLRASEGSYLCPSSRIKGTRSILYSFHVAFAPAIQSRSAVLTRSD